MREPWPRPTTDPFHLADVAAKGLAPAGRLYYLMKDPIGSMHPACRSGGYYTTIEAALAAAERAYDASANVRGDDADNWRGFDRWSRYYIDKIDPAEVSDG